MEEENICIWHCWHDIWTVTCGRRGCALLFPKSLCRLMNSTRFPRSPSCTAAYDAAVVALDGPDGLTAVRELRQRAPLLPILWIADEMEYAVFAFRYRVTAFLLRDASTSALRSAINTMRRESA